LKMIHCIQQAVIKFIKGSLFSLIRARQKIQNSVSLNIAAGPTWKPAGIITPAYWLRKLSDYKISGLGNRYIGITGTVTYRDGSKNKIDIDLNFDRAISNFAGLPPEIIVPEEFRNKVPEGGGIVDEIERLYRLYKEGALTKEEYEVLKKKVIGDH
jgi:hypothetical protein